MWRVQRNWAHASKNSSWGLSWGWWSHHLQSAAATSSSPKACRIFHARGCNEGFSLPCAHDRFSVSTLALELAYSWLEWSLWRLHGCLNTFSEVPSAVHCCGKAYGKPMRFSLESGKASQDCLRVGLFVWGPSVTTRQKSIDWLTQAAAALSSVHGQCWSHRGFSPRPPFFSFEDVPPEARLPQIQGGRRHE